MTAVLAAPAMGFEEFYRITSTVPAVALLLALPLSLLLAARQEGIVLRVLGAARGTPWRSFGTGLLLAVAFVLLAAASGQGALFGVLAALTLIGLGAFGLFGLAAEARALGCDLRGVDPHAPGPAGGSAALGWFVLAGLPLLPVAGPLVLLYLYLRAVGAALVAAVGGGEGTAGAAR